MTLPWLAPRKHRVGMTGWFLKRFKANCADLQSADRALAPWAFSGAGLRNAGSGDGRYIRLRSRVFTRGRAVRHRGSHRLPGRLRCLPPRSHAPLRICTWSPANSCLKNPLPNPLCIVFLRALLCIRVYFLEKLSRGKIEQKGL